MVLEPGTVVSVLLDELVPSRRVPVLPLESELGVPKSEPRVPGVLRPLVSSMRPVGITLWRRL